MINVETIDDQFEVIKPLGKGYTAEVLLANHIESNTQVAIKIYKPSGNQKTLDKNFANEVNTMKTVNHQNVVKILAGNNHGVHKRPGKLDREIMYMGIELCAGGEFFDYIADPGKGFSENTARYYFKQLMNGVKAIHDAGLAHRDLKTENLFVDGEMNVKVGDFGFAKFIEDNAFLKTSLGTPGYQCPELLEGEVYSGTANDIFACGVILFIMYCGFPPFREAKKYDPWYRHYVNKNSSMFWQMHTKQKRTPTLSESFRQLIDGMLSAKDRFTINDIANSTWVNEKEVDLDLVREDMIQRKEIVQKNKQKMNDQMDVDDGDMDEKAYRGADDAKEELDNFIKKFEELEFESYQINKWSNSEFHRNDFLKLNLAPTKAFKDICSKLILQFPGIKVTLGKDGFKGQAVRKAEEFTETTEVKEDDLDLIAGDLDFEFELKSDNDSTIVEFSKNESMSQYDFKNFYTVLRQSYEISA